MQGPFPIAVSLFVASFLLKRLLCRALSSTSDLVVVVYANSCANARFAVTLGCCFGQDWVHVVGDDKSLGRTTPMEYTTRHGQRALNMLANLLKCVKCGLV